MKGYNALILSIFVFLAAMLLLSVVDLNTSLPIKEELTVETLFGILTTFMFLTLIVERFADVVITAPREFHKEKIWREIAQAKENKLSTDELQSELRGYRMDTLKQTMALNLFLGFCIGCAGYRVLSMITGAGHDLGSIQKLIYHASDILLTAGLIAGGSKGINVVSSAMKNWFIVNKNPNPRGQN